MQNASYYRSLARTQLGGNIFSKNWLMALLAALLASLVVGTAAGLLFGVGGILAEGICTVGLFQCFLAVARGKNETYELKELLAGKDHIGKLLLLSVMRNLFLFLWMLVPIVGFVKIYSYYMTYYIQCDHPEYSWKEAITESRRMMDGYKWKLFCLELSFIGWDIVGMLTMGIGTYWVAPYKYAAVANFYEDLKKQYENTPVVM